MIRDIPSSEDFQLRGIDLLNLAWEEALSLLRMIDGVREWDEEHKTGWEYDKDEFWTAAQRPLGVSFP